MNATVWLKISAKQISYGQQPNFRCGTVHASKSKPDTKENEIAVKLELDIPNAIFSEPVYEAKLKLPNVSRQLPEVSEVTKEVQNALSERLGFKVKLTMEEPQVEAIT